MSEEEPKKILHSANIIMLDPIDCGSTVGYRVSQDYAFSGEVYLTDCNRKICWYFNDNPGSVEKINKAIKMLSEFKKEFIKGQKEYNKKKKVVKEEKTNE